MRPSPGSSVSTSSGAPLGLLERAGSASSARGSRTGSSSGPARPARQRDRLGRRPGPRPVAGGRGRAAAGGPPGMAWAMASSRSVTRSAPRVERRRVLVASRWVRLRTPRVTSDEVPSGATSQSRAASAPRAVGLELELTARSRAARRVLERRAESNRARAVVRALVDRARSTGLPSRPRTPLSSPQSRIRRGSPGRRRARPSPRRGSMFGEGQRSPRPSGPAAPRSWRAGATGSCIQARSTGSSMIPVSLALQPVVPPAQALLEEADRGPGLRLVRDRRAPTGRSGPRGGPG